MLAGGGQFMVLHKDDFKELREDLGIFNAFSKIHQSSSLDGDRGSRLEMVEVMMVTFQRRVLLLYWPSSEFMEQDRVSS